MNPRIGAVAEGGGETLYTGPRPTKFGIFAEQLDGRARDRARVTTSRSTPCTSTSATATSTSGLPVFEETVRRVGRDGGVPAGRGLPDPRGEHGRRARRAAARRRRAARPGGVGRDPGAATSARSTSLVATEPGDFLVKECGVHLAEVVTVEDARGPHVRRARHGLERDVRALRVRIAARPGAVPRRRRGPGRARSRSPGTSTRATTCSRRTYPFPEVREGDIVAAIDVGSYNASMTSEHCLREPAGVVCFGDRR